MNLNEIEKDLPNGFHDALMHGVALDVCSRVLTIDLQLSTGDPDETTKEETEAYKRATLSLSKLSWFTIAPPGAHHHWPSGKPLRVDGGEVTGNSISELPEELKSLPVGVFACWFFISDWNSFIYAAAEEASLRWS